jgi:hypothetical protein
MIRVEGLGELPAIAGDLAGEPCLFLEVWPNVGISLRQSRGVDSVNGSASFTTPPLSLAVLSGSAVTAECWTYAALGAGPITCVDSLGNTLTRDATKYSGANTQCDVFRLPVLPAGGASYKLTFSAAGSTDWSITFQEWLCSGGLVLDGAGSTNSGLAFSTVTTGAFSTSNANDLILCTFACGQVAGAIGVPTGFTDLAQSHTNGANEDGDACYELVASLQVGINPQWTAMDTLGWASIGLAYKEGSPSSGRILVPAPLSGEGGGGSLFTDPLGR